MLVQPCHRRGGDAGAPIPHRTVVSLLAAWAAQLREEQLAGIYFDVEEPARFATPWGLPSVAADDGGFCADVMWRVPIWDNTTYLVGEGLERCGCADMAVALRQQIMGGVER